MANIQEALIEQIINRAKVPELVEYNTPPNLLLVGDNETILFDRNWLIDGTAKIRTMEYYFADTRRSSNSASEEMRAVGFDAARENVKEFATAAINWARNLEIEGYNSYLQNMKIICSSDYCESRDLGILVSLVPTYQRELNTQIASKKKENELAEEAATSEYVGEVGSKVSLDTESVECVSCVDSIYGMTYLLKFSDADGNIYMWSTSNGYVKEIEGLKHIAGTVKRHEEFRGVKQTWLTRCRVTAIA